MATINGKAYWAAITVPNTKYAPTYMVDLVISEEEAEEFRARGFTVKDKDYGPTLTFKRKQFDKHGVEKKVPRLVNKDKTPFTESVGNGSDVKVQYREWFMEYDNKPIQGLELQAVQVINLVPYAGADGEEFEVEDYDEEEEGDEL